MGLLKKLEDVFAAAAFAEEGEFDKARGIMKESKDSAEKAASRTVLINRAMPLVPEED